MVPVPEDSFYAEEISDEIFARMEGKSFPPECTTKREDLRYIHLLYKDAEGAAHEGEMVCNFAIADKLINIFRKLYDADYPIERMVLIDEYGADDDASMDDNNTSCFNFRYVSGTGSLSKHALGMAVDLNPFYNPYIRKIDGETVIEPPGSEAYADRTADFMYKIDKDDLAYELFTEEGFTWGGSWKNSKDYQHFQYTK
ncbi:MAG: M15 family metallopeptidase [Lachnospiraceae bacterium]|nr:M15 family metallopeptidase [Lachnospiraceae bacterium]